jgi:hypothetical protein
MSERNLQTARPAVELLNAWDFAALDELADRPVKRFGHEFVEQWEA